jgi:AhpD family alkylhydroperoxidase
MKKDYQDFLKQLNQQMGKLSKGAPGTMEAFQSLHKAALGDDALTEKTKELIALGISIALRCEGCIVFHVNDALKAGATRKEVLETISVAILMGGGPSVIYGCQAIEALEQFG